VYVLSNKHVGHLFYFEQTDSKEESILKKKDLNKNSYWVKQRKIN
jgi:hypothetical protein